MAAGDALGILQVGGIFGALQELNPEVQYEFVAPPATDDPADTYIVGSPGVALGVNANSSQKDLAREFVAFLAQPDQINTFVETLGGVVPAIPNDVFQPR